MILGRYPASLYAMVSATSGILSIIICYYLSVWLKQERPFPHTYISNTAAHYPGFVFFRIGTISGTVFTILAHFANYFWLKTLAYESVFRLSKYWPKISLVTGIMGGLFLFVSTATIDTGKNFPHLHVWCASGFFLTTILSCLYNTFICFIMYTKTGKISTTSMSLKLIFAVAFIYQIYLGQNDGAYDSIEAYIDSDLSHILQYTLAFSVMGYFYTMAYDLKGFRFSYYQKKQ